MQAPFACPTRAAPRPAPQSRGGGSVGGSGRRAPTWLGRRLRRFAAEEEGSATIEALLWIPFFFWVLLLGVQVTMISTSQSRVLRIVQDGNRSYALGRLDYGLTCPAGATTVTAPNTHDFIANLVKTISPNATTTSQLNCATKAMISTVSMPATDLSGYLVLPNSKSMRITVSAQQIKEY